MIEHGLNGLYCWSIWVGVYRRWTRTFAKMYIEISSDELKYDERPAINPATSVLIASSFPRVILGSED